jgi:hypothetical protein
MSDERPSLNLLIMGAAAASEVLREQGKQPSVAELEVSELPNL